MKIYTPTRSNFYPPAIFTPNVVNGVFMTLAKYAVVFATENFIPTERMTFAIIYGKFTVKCMHMHVKIQKNEYQKSRSTKLM